MATKLDESSNLLDAELAERSPLVRWYLAGEDYVLPLVSWVIVLVAWELAAQAGMLDPTFFSSPSAVVLAGIREVQIPRFWYDVQISGLEFLVGYLAAMAIAIPFGLITGWYRPLHLFFDPWLNAFNATPRIALIPLIVLWVGLGIWSKIAVVFLGVFFPVAINTFHGVRTVEQRFLDVATTYGASTSLRFWTLILPSALPFVLTGARIGVGRAIVGVLVGEFYSSDAGLGRMVYRAGQALQTDRLLFGALLITVLALFAFRALSLLENRFAQWRPRVGAAE